MPASQSHLCFSRVTKRGEEHGETVLNGFTCNAPPNRLAEAQARMKARLCFDRRAIRLFSDRLFRVRNDFSGGLATTGYSLAALRAANFPGNSISEHY